MEKALLQTLTAHVRILSTVFKFYVDKPTSLFLCDLFNFLMLKMLFPN